MRSICTMAAAIVLSACSTTADSPPPAPANYRAIVKDYMRETLFDPYSVRDAQLSEPFLKSTLAGKRWIVCFKGNAKNRMGGYTGIQETQIVLDGSTVATSDSEYAALTCRGAVYSPFPEMMASG